MKKGLLIIITLIACVTAEAQQFTLPQNNNAALRYWAAFAEMKDRALDDSTSRLIDEVLDGSAGWDEKRLGPIVEENAYAVRAMQRAVSLPECNWGLDYSLGAAMPLAHLPKSRTLARLNALYGVRQLSRGEADSAVATWLAGLRFAQHVGKDIGLIGTLSAKPAFLANLHLLTAAVQSGAMNSQQQGMIRAALTQLPPDGVLWVESIRSEAWADEQGLQYMAKAQSFSEVYKRFIGSEPPAGAKPPSQADMNAFRGLMNEVIAAFQLPQAQTQERLPAIIAKLKEMNPTIQAIVPNYERLSTNRKSVTSDMEALLKSLK
ncbi:MAG TPA: hypothetical protein VE133_18990 [Candidatus Sulfotelmatobacter sp.]|nr:hypothetical protein [Candidatus Sulfotelmatobacter sp.]